MVVCHQDADQPTSQGRTNCKSLFHPPGDGDDPLDSFDLVERGSDNTVVDRMIHLVAVGVEELQGDIARHAVRLEIRDLFSSQRVAV